MLEILVRLDMSSLGIGRVLLDVSSNPIFRQAYSAQVASPYLFDLWQHSDDVFSVFLEWMS